MTETTLRRPIKWSYGAETDKGMVREVNEDAIFTREDLGLWAVADGLGGHAVGDVASQMVIDSLAQTQNRGRLSAMVDSVEDQLLDVNQRILDYADLMLDRATMGSTIVSLLIRGRVGVCLWAGDSRLYRYRNNELTQLSCDHSQVQEWVEQGLIKQEESENHPQGNVITRAIGVDEEVNIDMNVFSTQIGDTYLLCSDGLHNTVSRDAIEVCLRQASAQSCVDDLMALALENGAPDNVSLVVIKGEPGKIRRARDAA